MKHTPLFLLTLLWLTFSACSKKTDAPIPTDAAFVLHINAKSFSDKLPWEEIKKSPWFQMAVEEAKEDSLFTSILNDPTQSGLDLSCDGWIFLANRGKGAYSAFVWDLKDANKFEALIKKSAPDAKIERQGSNRYIADNPMVLVWNEEKIMAISDASDVNRGLNEFSVKGKEKSTDMIWADEIESPEETEEPFTLKKEDLLQIATEIQALKSNQKLSNDDKFADLINTKGDVHFWLNVGKTYNNTLGGNLLSLSKLGNLLEGNIGTATINFNDGSIDIDTKNYVGKELAALYEKYEAAPFNDNALKNIPAGDVSLALVMNYPPAGLKALLALAGVDGLVNTYLQKAGFSMDQFIQANTGNLFVSLSDFQVNKVTKTLDGFDGEPLTIEDTEPDGKILFGVEIKERSAFDKMIDVLKKFLTGNEEGGEKILGDIPYVLKDTWFLASNDSSQLKNFGVKKTDHPFIDRIKGHPFGMYINLTRFIQASQTGLEENSAEKQIAALSDKFWKELIVTGGEFKNGGSLSQVRITLGDPATNSLTSINQYFGEIAKLAKADEERRKKEWESIPEPTPTPVD